MLNEKREYELYLTKGYGGLIRGANLSDSLNGIRSVLTVLARGFLDKCRESEISDMEKLSQYTIAFLKTWLVGKSSAKIQDKAIEGAFAQIESIEPLRAQLQAADEANLLEFMREKGISFKKKSRAKDGKTPDCLEYLLDKIATWDLSLFYESENSLNAVRFKSIVADALYGGSLKNEVLFVRKDKPNHGLSGSFDYDRMWSVLGIVAKWLQQKPEQCQSGVIVLSQLSNYIGKRAYSKDRSERYDSVNALIERAGYTYNGKPLFVLEEVTRSCNKLWVSQEWLSDYCVHLAPASAPDMLGYDRYDDSHLRPLIKHK